VAAVLCGRGAHDGTRTDCICHPHTKLPPGVLRDTLCPLVSGVGQGHFQIAVTARYVILLHPGMDKFVELMAST
jgi:hypothetical protein